MSYLRTRNEHEAMGGADWQDFDSSYPKTSGKETAVEATSMDAKESGALSGTPASLDHPGRPRSLALAQIAANLIHSAYEQGYSAGFSAGRLAGLDFAAALREAPTGQVRHVPGINPNDGLPKPF